MQCPYCGEDSRVLDSRAGQDQVRRRRECGACSRRFTTYEKLAESEVLVAKRGGRTEAFDRDKLAALVSRLARGRKQPASALRDLVRGLEAGLIDFGARTVASALIAERLLARLGALDAVMAQRFAANYRGDDGTVRFSDDAPSPQLDLLAPPPPPASAAAPAPVPAVAGRPRRPSK